MLSNNFLSPCFVLLFTVMTLNQGKVNGVWDEVRVTFTAQAPGAYKIPLDISKNKDVFEYFGQHNIFKGVTIYCIKGDPRVCALYDKKNLICGLRVSYPASEIDKKLGDLSYLISGTAYGIKVLYSDILFGDPECLKKVGYLSRKEPVGESLWFHLAPDKYTQVPRKESDMAKKPNWYKQLCFSTMGQHYFYTVTKTNSCDKLIPFFGLYDSTGELSAFGTFAIGKFSVPVPPKRKWFETVTEYFGKQIFIDYPQCLAEAITTPGIASLHVYLTKKIPTCKK